MQMLMLTNNRLKDLPMELGESTSIEVRGWRLRGGGWRVRGGVAPGCMGDVCARSLCVSVCLSACV